MFEAIPLEMRSYRQWVISRFIYNKRTGKVFYRKQFFSNKPTPRQKQWNTRFAGKEAGFISANGYVRISIGRKFIYAHQVAFIIKLGFVPEEVDHKDKIKTNNEWNNLRASNRETNSCNCFKRKNNKLGIKGVSWSKSNNCWRMDIQHKKQKFHSYHKTIEEAKQAYSEMSLKLHKEFGYAE